MESVDDQIEQIVKDIRGTDNLNMNESPASLGFDSLDFVELEMAIEDEFEVSDIPEKFFNKPLSELARFIEGETKHGD